jgi:superfamily I DNA/RNA helicase
VQEPSDLIDTMLSIMRNKRSSTRVVELAAEVIAADARFNEKVGNAKARSEPGDWIFRSIDFASQVTDELWRANRIGGLR